MRGDAAPRAPRLAKSRALLGAAGTFGGLRMSTLPASARGTSANCRLNIGVVGVGDCGGYNPAAVKGENILALRNIDEIVLGPAAK